MGYLSRNDLERIATRVFNDYKHLPRLAGQQVDHVDPEILACGLCLFSCRRSEASRFCCAAAKDA